MDDGTYNENSRVLPILRQGTIVEYQVPQAIGPEVSFNGPQRAIIISSSEYNRRGSHSLCVCPYFDDATELNKAFGTRISLQSGQEVFVRTDLASFVGRHRMRVIQSRRTENPWVWSPYTTTRVVNDFLSLIKYDGKKTAMPAPRGFLRYGEMGWFSSIPYSQTDESNIAAAVCLSIPSQYEQTGLMLVARGYTHIERGNPRLDVALAGGHFAGAFISTTSLMAVSIKRVSNKMRDRRATLNKMALKGIEKKLTGTLNNDFYNADIAQRYSLIRNDWPNKIKAALKSRPNQGFRGTAEALRR